MRGPLLILLLLCLTQLGAQNDSSALAGIPEERIELREFDREAVEKLRAEIDYDQDLRRVPTLWERFQEWIGRWLQRIFGSRIGATITENMVYVIIGIALLFAVIMLSRGGFQRIFQSAPRSLGEVAVSEDDIREMDLIAMIEQAEKAGDLRRAIRLHYLLVLRGLVDRNVLEWHPHYTDQEYMAGISDPQLRSRFAHVALVFQWVWYGNAAITATDYPALRRPFIEFESATAA